MCNKHKKHHSKDTDSSVSSLVTNIRDVELHVRVNLPVDCSIVAFIEIKAFEIPSVTHVS